MERVEKTIFISYRRANSPWARAIYQDLVADGYDAFFDSQSINSGDFSRVIIENIKARAHFLLLLTPSALERCEDPNDWLRREIETAMDYKRNIIPVMLESFDFGNTNNSKVLVGKLEVLKNYNGLRIYSEYFDEGMARLRDRYLNTPLDAVLHPVSTKVQKATQEQKEVASSASQVNQEELSSQEWFEQGYKYGQANNHDEAIHLNPSHAHAYNNRGFAYANKGDLETAMKDYSQAIELDPDSYYPFSNRGFARYTQGDIEGAIRDYNHWIRLKPENADAYINRGLARHSKGDVDGALKDYDEAVRFRPDHADAYINRGLAHFEKGDLDKAIKDYNEAIRLNPDNANAYTNRGLAYYNKDDIVSAIKDYSKAIQLKPDDASAYNKRGVARLAKEDLEGAIEDYTLAIKYVYEGEEYLPYNNRGWARRNKGDLDGAVEDFTEAIRLNPNYAEPYANRGATYYDKGDYRAALGDYETYIKMNGENKKGVEEFLPEVKEKLKKK